MGTQANDVVITGLGPVTAIGIGCDSFWSALLNRSSRVVRRTLPVDLTTTVELPIASIPPTDEVPGLAPYFHRLGEQDLQSYRDLAYTLLAIELALRDAQLELPRPGNRVGMVQAFEAPGVEVTVADLFKLFAGMGPGAPPPSGPPPIYDLLAPRFYAMQPFLYVHVIGKVFGLHGFCTNVHNACSSGAFAIDIAADCIRRGTADVMIVVGGEAYETAVRLEWFRRLELYSMSGEMRPFDEFPSGFFVGEGGAALVLESAEYAARRGATPYAEYLGGAFAHQAWKQTIPDVRSGRLGDVIRRVLSKTGTPGRQIDLIVPHAACTSLSDGYEGACLNAALSGTGHQAALTAFKPYFGHMLAASGLIETIGALLSMHHQTVLPTPHAPPRHAGVPGTIVDEPTARRVQTLLKVSTGFTGHDAAAVFQRLDRR